jgi:hypothetical protein
MDAVGLNDVAVDGNLPLAQCLKIDHRTQAAADQPLNFNGAAALLAGGCLAAGALGSRARQHAVFSGDPAAPLSLEPGRQPLFQAGGDQHMGVAEFYKAGAFGVFHHAALEGYGTQLIDLSAAWPHWRNPFLKVPAVDVGFLTHAGAHHNHLPCLNKAGPMVNCWVLFEELRLWRHTTSP